LETSAGGRHGGRWRPPLAMVRSGVLWVRNFNGARSGTAIAMCSRVPSLLHEKLVELFETRPALAGELLRASVDDAPLSAGDLRSARVDSSSFEQTEPPQYSADKVVLFGGPRPV